MKGKQKMKLVSWLNKFINGCCSSSQNTKPSRETSGSYLNLMFYLSQLVYHRSFLLGHNIKSSDLFTNFTSEHVKFIWQCGCSSVHSAALTPKNCWLERKKDISQGWELLRGEQRAEKIRSYPLESRKPVKAMEHPLTNASAETVESPAQIECHLIWQLGLPNYP